MRLLRYPVLALAVMLIAAFAGSTTLPYGTNQILARGDVVAQVASGHFVWKSDPGWVSSDGTAITYNDFITYVNSSGCTTPVYGTGQLESQAMADSCKVTYTQHNVALSGINATSTYNCTYDAGTTKETCTNLSASPWSYNSPSGTVVSSTNPIGISLTGMTNSGSCGDGLSYTVSLLNPSGTSVWSASYSTATMSYSYSTPGATGVWTWKISADSQTTNCALLVGPNSGSFTDTANGSGTATVYY